MSLKLELKLLKHLKGIISINSDENIEDMPADNGVIRRIKDINQMEWWPMAGYSLSMKTDHCLTLETPTKLPMATRVRAHLVALDHALMCYPQ